MWSYANNLLRLLTKLKIICQVLEASGVDTTNLDEMKPKQQCVTDDGLIVEIDLRWSLPLSSGEWIIVGLGISGLSLIGNDRGGYIEFVLVTEDTRTLVVIWSRSTDCWSIIWDTEANRLLPEPLKDLLVFQGRCDEHTARNIMVRITTHFRPRPG